MQPNILELTAEMRQNPTMRRHADIECVEEMIPANQLSVLFADAQRGLDARRVKAIAGNIDDILLGHVVVSLPGANGVCHVIDGQHRVEAIRAARGGNAIVRCHMTDVAHDDHARLAWLFAMLNTTRKKVNALDLFNSFRAARSDDHVRVSSILSGFGLKVGQSANGDVSCPDALLLVYRKYGGGVLTDTIDVLLRCYGAVRAAFTSPMVRGVALFVTTYPDMDRSRLVKKVRGGLLADPQALQNEAKMARRVNNLHDAASGVSFVLRRE